MSTAPDRPDDGAPAGDGEEHRRRQSLALAPTTLGVALLVGLAVVGADRAGLLDGAERASQDTRARLLARPAPDSLPIRVVLVDEASLEQEPWPWPREAYGAMVEVCRRAPCRGLAFDLLMPDPDVCHGTDGVLAAALAGGEDGGGEGTAPPVVLAVKTSDGGDRESAWPSAAPSAFYGDLEPWRRAGGGSSPLRLTATFPHLPLAVAADAFGHVDGSPGDDATVRRIAPLHFFDGDVLPALGLALWAHPHRHDAALTLEPNALALGDTRFPIDRQGFLRPRFRRPRPDLEGHLYPALAAAPVIAAGRRLRRGELPTDDDRAILAELRQAWVVFGLSAPALHDNWPTPVAPLLPGAEVQATLLDNLENGTFLRPAPPATAPALVLLLALVTGPMGIALGQRPWLLALVSPLLLAVAPIAGAVAWDRGVMLPVAAPTAAVVAALVAGTLLGYVTEGRQRRFLRRAFERYLSPAVVERLVREPERLRLGGERRELTLFFSDLAGFSSFSERLDPRQLTALLNDYLSAMTELILAAEGTLDKYEGDAILAFWNAPLGQADHALRACRTALACQRRLAALRAHHEAGWGVALEQRIGIHSGPVVVGNLGSSARFDYTVLGDAANLASRLEGANKLFGSDILVSDRTWQATGGALLGREVGDLVVVGRREVTRVHQPLGEAGDPAPDWLPAYGEALTALRTDDRGRAWRGFQALAEADPVSAAYRDRLLEARQRGETWDGVWRPASK